MCLRKIIDNYFKRENTLVNILSCIILVSNNKKGVYDFKQYCESPYYCPRKEEEENIPYCGIK